MQNLSSKKLLVLEGNIGAGKSTMLELIKRNLPVSIIPEPTDKWQNVNNNDNLLDLFYKDTPRWAYTFQSYAFLTRVHSILEHLLANPGQDLFILERSVYCDRFCFAKTCYEAGFMSPLEWSIYKDWFAWLVEHNYAPRPAGFIYLRVDPATAYNRIKRRERSEESSISLDYLTTLHNKHDNWLVHRKEPFVTLKNVPILVLDCNPEFEGDLVRQRELLEQISSFAQSLENSTKIPATSLPSVQF